MLGALLLKKNELAEAEQVLLRTTRLEAEFAKPHEDLGLLYLKLRKAEQARASFASAVALDASLTTAFRGLAVALRQLGRFDEARAAEQAVRDPSRAGRALAQAELMRAAGDDRRAEQICEDVLQQEPENTAALRLLAIIASGDERQMVAEGLLRRILKLEPGSSDAVRDLGRFLADQSRFPEAIELLEQAAQLDTSDSRVRLMLGDLYTIVGQTAAALQSYEECLELSPNEPMALLGRGHMLRITGKRDEAECSYRKCIAMQPAIGDAWWSLASLHGYRAGDDEMAQMHAQIEKPDLHPESGAAFRFALARAYEKRNDFDAAWRQYVAANEVKRGLVSYDPVEIEVRHNKMIKAFNEEFFERVFADEADAVTPIFIVGMPRSGSTLIEQILASHSDVEGAGELPYIIMMSSAGSKRVDRTPYPEMVAELDESEMAALGKSYLYHAATHCIAKKPYFTDKMPANFSHIGFILSILPNAKIIDARRDPLATCVANYRHLFAKGKNQTYDLTELGEYYLQYVRIMEHWDRVLPGAVLRIQYEEVVADLKGQVLKILDHCGLAFEESCIEFHRNERPVNTASSEQVRQPIYKSGLDFHEHYAAHLGVLREILAPLLLP
jgi:tetratricopeptide (TPR) repeat protein